MDDGVHTVVEEKGKKREGKERKGKEASLAKVARFRIAYAISRNSWHGQEIPQELCVSVSPRNFSFVFCPRSSHRRAIINRRWTKKGLNRAANG